MVSGNKPVEGSIASIIYRKGAYVVGLLNITSHSFAIRPERIVVPKGGDIQAGVKFRFYGRLILSRKYKLQFVCSNWELSDTASRARDSIQPEIDLLDALRAGLVPGIGAGTGARLADYFGEDLRTMDSPDALTVMDGIGTRRAHSILANIQRYQLNVKSSEQ